MVPMTRAFLPVPITAVVNSRPGRYSSSSTCCPKASSSRAHAARSSSGPSMRERSSMPLPVPSAMGLAKSGKRRPSGTASERLATTLKFGVGRPWERTRRLATALSRVAARTRGSENTYGTPYSSRIAGAWASRDRPRSPSAMLKTRSHRSPRTRRAHNARAWPIRSVAWPSACSVASKASMVASVSSSAICSSV